MESREQKKSAGAGNMVRICCNKPLIIDNIELYCSNCETTYYNNCSNCNTIVYNEEEFVLSFQNVLTCEDCYYGLGVNT
jgi:hypothetical protein